MITTVEREDKVRIARFGANKIFRVDFDERSRMIDDELVKVFDNAWSTFLEQSVTKAEKIEAAEVSRRLLDQYHPYIDDYQEHRTFKRNQAEFIVQLEKIPEDAYRLTQLWRVKSSDEYPKTLFVNFNTIEEIERFRELADSLNKKPEILALQLIRNFMDLHPGYVSDPAKADT